MTVLSFFDPPRKGELLYSALARHGSARGLTSPKATMAELFGRPSTIATLDLPNSLGALFSRVPALAADALSVIGRHTLFGYYTAFQPAFKAQQALRMMMGVSGGPHLPLGVATFRTGRPSHLQFCPICLDDMEETYGSLHWRTDHQLPGLLVCPEHGCRLLRSEVALSAVNRHAFVRATRDLCPTGAEPVTALLDGVQRDRALQVARASAALLVPAHAGRTPVELRDDYRARLADAGFVRGRHKVDQAGLRAAFSAHFGGLVDRLPGVELDCATETWLHSIVRSGNGAHPPLQHVLLGIFLDASAGGDAPRADEMALAEVEPDARSGQSATDWRALDLRYAAFITRRAGELRRQAPPVRVTAAAIERGAGRRNWLTKRRAKLPRSTRAMAEQLEGVEAFRLRRVRWHVQCCLAEGEVDPWVVHRRAGLPHRHIDMVRDELSGELAGQPLARLA